MELKSERTPRGYPRDAPPYFALPKISGLFYEATIRWLRTSCRWRTPVRAAVFCRSPSVGGYAGRETLPMWRPARRLGARRYVKERRSLCEGTAKLYPTVPWDARGHAQKAAVLSKIVRTLSAALRLGLTCRVENLQRRIKSSEIRLVPSY